MPDVNNICYNNYILQKKNLYRLSSNKRSKLVTKQLGKVLNIANRSEFFMNIYFEERFDQDIDDLRREMKIIN